MVSHPKRSRASAKIAAAVETAHTHEHDYSALLIGVRSSFENVTSEQEPLFLTDIDGLNDLYLDNLPAERQVHNCHACRKFLNAYGGLACISSSGLLIPAMWNPEGVPDFYHAAFSAMHAKVRRARVVSPFLSKERVWGLPITGTWSHMAVTPPERFIYRERVLTAKQAMAAAKENFRTVTTALSELTAPILDEAIRILSADALARSEKFIGPAKWLRALHDRPKGRAGENVLWRAIAVAPEGYCHPKASVIGPLLADIAAGLPFEEIKAKFEAMLHPLRYQRPQAAPSAGNIKAAEAVVAKLGIAPALARRFARLDELKTLWLPTSEKPAESSGGVFGHIKAKNAAAIQAVDLPVATMTWAKFAGTILPTADQLEMLVPDHGRFVALTAATHSDAPPILKWDFEDERNTIAWYVYHNGSNATQWRLRGGSWAKINAVVPAPATWGSRPMPFLGDGLVLVLDGAADTREGQGNALFPECLKDDLHGARATIEAYSRSAELTGRDEASACGYTVGNKAADCTIRARTVGVWNVYRIDRWD